MVLALLVVLSQVDADAGAPFDPEAYAQAHRGIYQQFASWERCTQQAKYDAALAGVAREKEKGRLVGVVNRGTLNELGEAAVDAKAAIKAADGLLKRVGYPPLACDSKWVKLVQQCLDLEPALGDVEATPPPLPCLSVRWMNGRRE
jgi:hypothetical protein